MLDIFSDLGVTTIIIVGLIAVLTSAIHGATGVAGGFLMTAALAIVIGVKPVVPVMSVALLISHSSRVFLNREEFNRQAYLLVAIPAVPCIILTAWLYGKMSSSLIALLLGTVVLLSIPLRRWARSRQIKTSRSTLMGVAASYGFISGASIGGGMLLVPFMLGFGLTKEAFVATLAAIAFTSNVARVSVFGTTALLDTQFLMLGVFVGLMTIPGNYLGRSILRKLTNDRHAMIVDVLTLVGSLNFFWMAFNQG
ncbi:MAG: sulfite exporter TauE/SafE family protein [Rhizobiaceae bacterium]